MTFLCPYWSYTHTHTITCTHTYTPSRHQCRRVSVVSSITWIWKRKFYYFFHKCFRFFCRLRHSETCVCVWRVCVCVCVRVPLALFDSEIESNIFMIIVNRYGRIADGLALLMAMQIWLSAMTRSLIVLLLVVDFVIISRRKWNKQNWKQNMSNKKQKSDDDDDSKK